MDHFQCDHLVDHWVNAIMAIVKETIHLATKLQPPHKIYLCRIKRYYKD